MPPERFAILGARPDGISDTASAVSGVGGEAAARTEAQAVQDDEREEFLRRENELADQLAEKERELKLATRTLDQLKAELAAATARESRLLEENKDGSSQVAALRIRLEQAEFNAREANINTDSLREQVEDLVGENEELKVRSSLSTLEAFCLTSTIRF